MNGPGKESRAEEKMVEFLREMAEINKIRDKIVQFINKGKLFN